MKQTNKFDQLSTNDQQFILGLCSRQPYAEVAEILRKPRPVGLALATSSSALCRWFTKRQAEVASTQVLGQLSKAIQVRHQSDASGHTEALLTLVQNRLFESILTGKAIADLSSEFRVMLQLHKAYLAEARWQASANPDADYKTFLSRTCELPDFDFCDPSDTSGALDELTADPEPEDLLIEKVQETNVRDHLLQELIRKMSASLSPGAPSTSIPEPSQPAPHSTPAPSKSPVIPPIPPNSASRPSLPAALSKSILAIPDVTAQFAAPLPEVPAVPCPKDLVIPHFAPNSALLPRAVSAPAPGWIQSLAPARLSTPRA